MFVYEDVTDRLALERSYNTLTAVQRETLNELREGVVVYGTDGRIKLCNPSFLRNWNLPESFVDSEPHIADVIERNRQQYRFDRSEEHTSELQSLMRISYAVFCLKNKKN